MLARVVGAGPVANDESEASAPAMARAMLVV
jgi:hypothetical protein